MRTQQHFTTTRQRCGDGPLTYTNGRNPLVNTLRILFDNLEDDGLLERLSAPRRGRPSHKPQAMWRSLIVTYALGLPSVNEMIRQLENNPALADVCGIRYPEDIPSKAAYSRFVKKLAEHPQLVEQCLVRVTNVLRSLLPDFAQTVAVDATDMKAWANGMKQETDPDAGTGAKHKSSRRVYWYGYKVHLGVCADTELPIWVHVTPANVYDGHHLSSVLNGASERYDWFKPQYVLADKGYDAKACFSFVQDMGADPVIDMRKRPGVNPGETRPCEAKPALTLWGVRYQCDRKPYDANCPEFERCPLLDPYVNTERRKTPYMAYGSAEWRAIYNKRVSVERVFSATKGFYRLDNLTHRGLPKVTLHCTLSMLVMQAKALGQARNGNFKEMRRCTRKVA